MSTKKEFIEYILANINDLDARTRAMFGEYCLYYRNKTVGLICDDTVFIKMTPSNKEILGSNQTGPAYPGVKDSYIITEKQIKEKGFLLEVMKGVYGDLDRKR